MSIAEPVQPEDSLRHALPEAAVREQLARILASKEFASSARLCRFLSHIVDRTLHGEPDQLKEFSLAMEVFDRSSNYDSNVDAIVRVEARRLRAKLKAYYETADDPVTIEVRPGSYVPLFRWRTEAGAEGGMSQRTAERRAVAVLPFANLSSEAEQEFFCDGMTEEILNSLAQVEGLRVIARTSVFQFKGVAIDIRQVGQRLGADLVIEGSVRKSGDQLRIRAQAVDTVTGHHLWTKSFQRELRDVFAVQEEIAAAVAALLRVDAPERGTGKPDVDAYTRYLGARYLIHQQSAEALRAAIAQLRKLAAEYPNYALAYSGLASAQGLLTVFGVVSGREILAETKEFAERGYALDPESAETCTVLGGFRAWFEYRWEEAKAYYDRALEIQPGHAPAYVFRGMTLLCQGDLGAGEASLRRAIELDPLSPSDCSRLAYAAYLREDFAEAGKFLERSRELDSNYAEARFYGALLQFRQENYRGIAESLRNSAAPLELGLCAAALARLGDREAARECVGRIRRLRETKFVTPLGEALAALGMGDREAALELLGEAIEHRTNFVNLLAVEPYFHPLRNERRFT